MSDCLGNPEGTPHTIYPCFIGVDSYCPVSPAPCPPASTFSLSRPEPNLIMSDGKKMTSSRRHHLKEICKKLSQAADKIDDERYDVESKVVKANKEIEDLRMKVVELGGVKKPALKKVRMSADAMLQALLGGKHKVTMDLRSNLKQVKKEVKEEATEAGDWRKNIEDKADRKKMFETS
uniref:Troponin I, fast skeletal muscle-like n=1 Tax=Gadus morhua TaxID=8049 RepID=A0A8C5CDY1_GADMO